VCISETHIRCQSTLGRQTHTIVQSVSEDDIIINLMVFLIYLCFQQYCQ
jgi:hypothetical protein